MKWYDYEYGPVDPGDGDGDWAYLFAVILFVLGVMLWLAKTL